MQPLMYNFHANKSHIAPSEQLSSGFEFALQGFAFNFETANLAVDAVEFFRAAVYFEPQSG